MSALTKKDPLPSDTIKAAKSSIDEYDREESLKSMPSLMLPPCGADGFTIRYHLPGFFWNCPQRANMNSSGETAFWTPPHSIQNCFPV